MRSSLGRLKIKLETLAFGFKQDLWWHSKQTELVVCAKLIKVHHLADQAIASEQFFRRKLQEEKSTCLYSPNGIKTVQGNGE
jgi:hypothetical protein